MPPSMRSRAVLLDLACRSNYICRSCLLNLRKPAPALPLASRAYSRAAQRTRQYQQSQLSHYQQQIQQRQNKPRQSNISTPTPPQAAADEDDSVTVRYFEMDETGKTRPLRDNAEFVNSLHAEELQVRQELDEMEAKLRQISKLSGLGERFGLGTPSESDKEVEERREQDEDEDEDGEDSFPHPIDTSGVNKRQARPLVQLNWQLQRTAKKIKEGNVKQKTVYDSWRLYALAVPILKRDWWRVPPGAWALLWEILSWDGPANTNRMGRVYQLGKDMRAAGVPLSDAQQILHIEAIFVQGARKEAIESWRRFAPGSEDLEDYLRLGLRMFSIQGDLDRAEKALDRLFECSPDLGSDPRVLLPFIRACTRDETKLEKAWTTYRRLRELLGEDMQIQDYDEVVSCFLLVDRTENALHVFVDMMFSGAVDLHGKTRLPHAVGNHFFLGKWLKRLIGAGDLDGALNVLRFMQQKGIMAAKVQVNGLIGAGFRSGLTENVAKAEELAWAMIRSRLMFVDLRRRESLIEWPIRLMQTADKRKKDDISAPDAKGGNNTESTPGPDRDAGALGLTFVPQASLETFSLMAENYKDRQLHMRLEELWVAFQEAEITTDAFMLNQLLESYIQEGQGAKAREVYRRLTEEHYLTPDAYTFFALYKTLAVNRIFWNAVTDEIRQEEAVICRSLFRDMVSSSWTFESESAKEELVRMVLHSFRKCGDHVGVLVALKALNSVFGALPDHVTIMEMLADTAELRHSQKKIMEVTGRIQVYLAEKRRASADAGQAVPHVEGMTTREKTEEVLGMVEEIYLRKIETGIAGGEEEFRELYLGCVEDMGLTDILFPNGVGDQ